MSSMDHKNQASEYGLQKLLHQEQFCNAIERNDTDAIQSLLRCQSVWRQPIPFGYTQEYPYSLLNYWRPDQRPSVRVPPEAHTAEPENDSTGSDDGANPNRTCEQYIQCVIDTLSTHAQVNVQHNLHTLILSYVVGFECCCTPLDSDQNSDDPMIAAMLAMVDGDED
jgi:hypothetical protein